jgi:hypothetical protein
VAEPTEEENVSNEQGFFSQGDYEAWKAQRAASHAAARRTLEEHDAHLRQLGTGDADHMAKLAKRTYMLEHGLEYRDQEDGRRVLTWAPSTVYSESAWEARQRHAAAVETQERHGSTVPPPTPQDGPHGAMLGGHAIAGGVVSQARASGMMFARSDILAIVRGQKALATSFQAREALDGLARIITNLED